MTEPAEQPIDHREALELAQIIGQSNLARCYLDLVNRLAQAPQAEPTQEPVAWRVDFRRNTGPDVAFYYAPNGADAVARHRLNGDKITPLYAAPVAQPERVKLLEEVVRTSWVYFHLRGADQLRDWHTALQAVAHHDAAPPVEKP